MSTKGKQISILKKMVVVIILVTIVSIMPARAFASDSLNSIEINGTTYDARQYVVNEGGSGADENALDKEALLRQLATQMLYQDPTDPQDNSEFIAQLAQFSTLEQMTNVSSETSRLAEIVENIDSSLLIGQLSTMPGKEVAWQSVTEEQDEDGNPIEIVTVHHGKVKSIKIDAGNPVVVATDGINDYIVHIGDIRSIGDLSGPQNTASILSEGNIAVITGISGVAVGFVLGGLVLGGRKKHAMLKGKPEEDEE